MTEPTCPVCHAPLIVYPRSLMLGELEYTGRGWLCLNTAAHGGRPQTAAIWLDEELEASLTTPEEWRELELVVALEVG